MPDTPETPRARVIRALSKAGAWCGQCDEPDVGCLDCAVVLAKYADVAIAALAATAGPLSAEEYGHLRDLVQTKKLGTRGAEKLLTTYDALAAQVTEQKQIIEAAQERFENVLYHNQHLTADLAALRATVARVNKVLEGQAYYGGGTASDLAERINDALAAHPTPTREGT